MELQRLIEAVESGKLPDEDWRLMHDIWSPRNWHDIGHNVRYSMHGSLDAAKALHDALLPGWDIQIVTYEDDSFEASVSEPMSVKTYDGVSQFMARAWLLAILKAYQQVKLAT